MVPVGGASGPAGAAPGIDAERAEMRRLLGSGIVVIDTNVCIDHFFHGASASGTLDRKTRAAFSDARQYRADDTIHELVRAAVREGRIRLHRIVHGEIGSVLDDITKKRAGLWRGMAPIQKLGLYGLYIGSKFILDSPSAVDIGRVEKMYGGFKTDPETMKALASLRRRKPRDRKANDIKILASAAALARSGRGVSLLTLDADFAEFAPQIWAQTGIRVVDGNPYMRTGRMLVQQDRYDQAEKYLEQAAAMGSDEEAAYWLAVVLARQGKTDRSKMAAEG